MFHLLPQERTVHTGDTLTVHCEYDASDSDDPVHMGLDEVSEEMCNHYLLSSADLEIECQGFTSGGEVTGAARSVDCLSDGSD